MINGFKNGEVVGVRKLSLDHPDCPYIGLVSYVDGSRVVVKEINRENKREIAILNRVGQHGNIVEKIGEFSTGEDCNLVRALKNKFGDGCEKGIFFEFVDGGNLQGLSVSDKKTYLSHIVYDVASALEHSHSRRVVHADVKPLNILITKNGHYKGAKLIDFDCSVYLGERKSANEREGTAYFRSPEQVYNAKVCFGSDIFSLGIIFYDALTGKEMSFGEKHSLEPRPAPSRDKNINNLVDAMLERDAKNRPTASDVKAVLTKYQLLRD
jgi:serine/threonine protein kinase